MTIQELEQAIADYGTGLYSFARHLTPNSDLADELYQETWLTALHKLQELDSAQNVKSYLLSMELRLWQNKRRKYAWRKRIAPTEEIREETLMAEENGLDSYLEKEKHTQVRQAVARLDDKYRIPILLYYMEEMSVVQVAAVMGIREGTVKNRLSVARKKLKKDLEGYLNER